MRKYAFLVALLFNFLTVCSELPHGDTGFCKDMQERSSLPVGVGAAYLMTRLPLNSHPCLDVPGGDDVEVVEAGCQQSSCASWSGCGQGLVLSARVNAWESSDAEEIPGQVRYFANEIYPERGLRYGQVGVITEAPLDNRVQAWLKYVVAPSVSVGQGPWMQERGTGDRDSEVVPSVQGDLELEGSVDDRSESEGHVPTCSCSGCCCSCCTRLSFAIRNFFCRQQ